MQIEAVHYQAEQSLLDRLRVNTSTWGALYMQHSRKKTVPNEEIIILATKTILEGRKAIVYFFADGDFVVTWQGMQKTTIEALRQELYKKLQLTPDETSDRYYDFQAHGEELRFLCEQKLKVLEHTKMHNATPLNATQEQLRLFQAAVQRRAKRDHLEILVVEDQPFSSKLMVSLLERICQTYAALDAHTALEIYLTHAPDIVFLDIEMPGIGGHELAAALRQLDEDVYIIMVTANNYTPDVLRAKQNGAKAFVAKPYSKKKILEGIEKYIHERKLKS